VSDNVLPKRMEESTVLTFHRIYSGAANIITHARNITTARRTDDTRKTARQVKAERKAEQAAVLAEKTKQEKGKKRREIEKRMETLRRELGDEAFKHLEKEMEGDWDEEVFDRAMDKVLAADMDDVSHKCSRAFASIAF
jgi:protein KRI1